MLSVFLRAALFSGDLPLAAEIPSAWEGGDLIAVGGRAMDRLGGKEHSAL
jgi:hypothetical protein